MFWHFKSLDGQHNSVLRSTCSPQAMCWVGLL